MSSSPRVLVAPDKLRGTATAVEAARAISAGVRRAGGTVDSCPMSDGGEGFLDAMGGPNRRSTVSDARGRPLEVPWRLDGVTAIVETAMLSNGALRARPGPAEAIAATSAGAGQLIAEALRAGARRVLVGLGGSAFTDGGIGAVQALDGLVPFAPEVSVILSCDVRTSYLEAARVFGPQKGADPAAIAVLTNRLIEQAGLLRSRFGNDIRDVAGTGAAGGLAGGLHAAGAELHSGFAIVADRVQLAARLRQCDLVITAEGRLDDSSLAGKVIGALIEQSTQPVWVLAGSATVDRTDLRVIDLSDRFGSVAATTETARCLSDAAAGIVQDWVSSGDT